MLLRHHKYDTSESNYLFKQSNYVPKHTHITNLSFLIWVPLEKSKTIIIYLNHWGLICTESVASESQYIHSDCPGAAAEVGREAKLDEAGAIVEEEAVGVGGGGDQNAL